MPQPKQSNSGTTGVKLLITATSLAATIGGWAAFTLNQYWPAETASAAKATPGLTDVSTRKAFVTLPPLPTLVPVQVVGVATYVPKPTGRPQPSNAVAVVLPPPTPVLRMVNAPPPAAAAPAPAPVTTTQSSR